MNILRNFALLLFVLCMGWTAEAQIPKGYKKTETGLMYTFHVDRKEGPNAKSGDILKLHFAIKTEKDSLLRSTFKEGSPLEMPLRPGPFKGSLEEGLMMMSVGDSATFLISSDSVFTKMFFSPLPPFIRKGSYMGFTIKMLKIMSEDDYKKEKEKQAAELVAKEDKTIQEYMTKNNLKGTKTSSGLYYVQVQPGAGAKAESGKKVGVHYTGKLLNGTKFDSSVDAGRPPIEFGLGSGQVIQGWDEGIALMSVGEKGILLIPSRLGYGPNGSPPQIPGNSILVFDVELVTVQ